MPHFWKSHVAAQISLSFSILVFMNEELVSAAKNTGLSLALSDTPKTGFVASWPILLLIDIIETFLLPTFRTSTYPLHIYTVKPV